MPSTAAAWVLDEDEALDLLAYLVTAARTQVDEAAEYGPLRLLTAARRLAERIAPRSSDATAAFVAGPLQQMPELAVPRDKREEYFRYPTPHPSVTCARKAGWSTGSSRAIAIGSGDVPTAWNGMPSK